MSEAIYTQEQLDIAILKNNNEGILRVMTDFKSQLTEIKAEIETHFHWTLGLIFGLYTIGLGAMVSAVGKAYGWF